MGTVRLVVLALVGALAVACGADVGEVGTRLVVDEARVTSEVLYMLPEISQVPFTALELEEQGIDRSQAIPIRIEIFENTSVAWFAPDGEARIGRDWIVALWSVERTPISDDTYAEGTPEVNVPASNYIGGAATLDSRPNYDIELTQVVGLSAAESRIIEFVDRLGSPDELAALEELVTAHPGCLEE